MIILCRSAERRTKERAMHVKFSRRMQAAMINRQIGRSLQARRPMYCCAFRPRRTADPVMADTIGAKRRKPVH